MFGEVSQAASRKSSLQMLSSELRKQNKTKTRDSAKCRGVDFNWASDCSVLFLLIEHWSLSQLLSAGWVWWSLSSLGTCSEPGSAPGSGDLQAVACCAGVQRYLLFSR